MKYYVHFHCKLQVTLKHSSYPVSLTTLDGPGSNSDGRCLKTFVPTPVSALMGGEGFVSTPVSALMGGEGRGQDVIFASVILEGLNVGKANLQPESMCAFKFFRVTILEHEDLSQKEDH